jgi:P22 coat protein - gene protein 5
MAQNTLLAPAEISKVAAVQISNNLVFARLSNKQYKEDFTVKIGQTISYRLPVLFNSYKQTGLVVQGVTENYGNITINTPGQVAWEFADIDLNLTIDQYDERYTTPAAIALAQQMDGDGAALATQVYNAVGTVGTAITFATMQQAKQFLDEFSVPMNGRYFALAPIMEAQIQNDVLKFFTPSDVFKDIVGEAAIGRLVGADGYMSQNISYHIAGTAAGLSLHVNSVSGDATVALRDSGAGTLTAGDILTFSGTNAVNPKNFATLGRLRQFVVLANYTLAAGSDTAVSIAPSIISSGPYQTVTALPTTASTVTNVYGNHWDALMWQKDAFALVSVPPPVRKSQTFSQVLESQGVGMRFMLVYDVTNEVEIARMDVLYGWQAIYPNFATRIIF